MLFCNKPFIMTYLAAADLKAYRGRLAEKERKPIMNKIMNQAERFVDESLSGIVLAHGDQLKFAGGSHRSIVRASAPVAGKVSIITGGGYGHLPVFLGYVGKGFCDGVAVGNVFTSPSCDAIVEATRAANGGAGILFLFGNYMGDSMNFEMARELLDMEGIQTAIVKVADDVASAPREANRERRGVGGIFFPYKIAGAKAERMAPLEDVRMAAEEACANVSTFGFSMSPCQLPGASKPVFTLDEGEMELGMGIHGEPGVERTKLMSSSELAQTIAERLIADQSLKRGDEVAVLVNGLGATAREELYILYGDFYSKFQKSGIRIVKSYVGEFATSMEMLGASISVFKLNPELLELLKDDAGTPFVKI